MNANDLFVVGCMVAYLATGLIVAVSIVMLGIAESSQGTNWLNILLWPIAISTFAFATLATAPKFLTDPVAAICEYLSKSKSK